MKISQRSWHFRLGAWAHDMGWIGRLSSTRRPYEPRDLCTHAATVYLGVPATVLLSLMVGMVLCVAVPLVLGMVGLETLANRLTMRRPRRLLHTGERVSRSLPYQWIAARKRSICPLLEVVE